MNNRPTMSVSVMSGKGGVGKTSVSLNLACALHALGSRALLMDCDFGLANLDVMLGLGSEATLQDVLLADAAVTDIVQSAGAPGFDVLPAASGVPELVDLDEDTRDVLVRRLVPVLHTYDYVFLDLGAGISATVQAFAGMTAARLIVVTPEPTAMTDSYALMKVMAHNHQVRDFFIVVNQAESRQEASQTFKRLQTACRHFLEVDPVFLGAIRQDQHVPDAVRCQNPFFRMHPQCQASRDVAEIAKTLASLRGRAGHMLRRKPALTPLPV